MIKQSFVEMFTGEVEAEAQVGPLVTSDFNTRKPKEGPCGPGQGSYHNRSSMWCFLGLSIMVRGCVVL
eukprot:3037042-Amphidinium_carterae.1